MEPNGSHRIFISFSEPDYPVAEALVSALDEAGFSPWIYKREVRPGESFIEAMNTALSNASYLLVLFSEAANSSRWLSREWMSALATKSTLVLPIMVDGSEPPPLLADIVHFRLFGRMEKGVLEIIEFFRRENQIPWSPRFRNATDVFAFLKAVTPRQVRLLCERCVGDPELKSFCNDAGFDIKRLSGDCVQERILSLIHFTAADGILEDFMYWLALDRKTCMLAGYRALSGTASWNWSIGQPAT